MRVGVHEGFEHVIALDLVDALQHLFIAAAQDVSSLVPGLAGEDQAQAVVLDPLAPEFVQLLGSGRPGHLRAVKDVELVDSKIGFLVQQAQRVIETLPRPLYVGGVDHKGGFEVATLDCVVELKADIGQIG